MDEKKNIELTGNNFIDAYNVGYQAASDVYEVKLSEANSKVWSRYNELNKAENRIKELQTQLEELHKENKKLRKKIEKAVKNG